ncbi:MAG: DUF928 domain-containing protein [Cyanobacteria bacterium P01_C01_bin.38]
MKLILTMFLILSGITQYAPQATAQRNPSQPARKPRVLRKPRSAPPKVPKGLTPISGRRRGMGSRDGGNCPAVEIPLTAIAPFQEQRKARKQSDKSSVGIVGGLTTLERPSFMFYLPYTQDLAGASAEFSLQDDRGTDVFRQQTALPAKSGIVSVSLPKTVKSLEIGQNYRWYFKVRCSAKTGRPPIYVNGYIQRINRDPRINKQLQAAANSSQRMEIYKQADLWFDAVNMLAQQRQSSKRTSMRQDWQSLLQSLNLTDITNQNFVN